MATRTPAAQAGSHAVVTRVDVGVPMRDGVRLSADLHLPDAPGAHPAVLVRTPYDNAAAVLVEQARRLANTGYACVLQDCRGRYDSDGRFDPFRGEGEDGWDTLEWIAAQPWCDGRIGMTGGSYLGWTQWAVAALGSPRLACLAPAVMTTDLRRGRLLPGGALKLALAVGHAFETAGRTKQNLDHEPWQRTLRHLPLDAIPAAAGRDLPFWRAWIAHREDAAFWAPYSFTAGVLANDVPALCIGGWFDIYAHETITAFAALRVRGGPRARASSLVIGPWDHNMDSGAWRVGELDFGAGAAIDLAGIELAWLDRWLKDDDGGRATPPIRLFVMGANRWREEHEWPLARTRWETWHLHSGGAANTLAGDGELRPEPPAADEPPDRYVYDPELPAPTAGGGNLPEGPAPTGPRDQREVEMRHDVLCYTSAPLEQDVEVTGPIRVVLFAATDAHDTDWTAKLVDVHPDGSAIGLCDGIVRARYRDGIDASVPLAPGECHRFEIGQMVTSNVFRAGHRIRLEISSSNFPRYDRNLNVLDADAVQGRRARQAVFHTPAHPSHVVLPVIPLP